MAKITVIYAERDFEVDAEFMRLTKASVASMTAPEDLSKESVEVVIRDLLRMLLGSVAVSKPVLGKVGPTRKPVPETIKGAPKSGDVMMFRNKGGSEGERQHAAQYFISNANYRVAEVQQPGGLLKFEDVPHVWDPAMFEFVERN